MNMTFSIISTVIIAAASAAILTYIFLQRRITQLKQENTTLTTTLEFKEKAAAEKQTAYENDRKQLSETFASLSGQALKNNTEQFLNLAQEKLKQFNIEAQGNLEKKEQAIEHIIKPIKEALEKTEKQLRNIEHERKEAYGSISKHLESMTQTQQMLHGETRNLAQALRRPEVRGQWGELTLKRLVELAGMAPHCDFYEQEHTQTDEGAIRPDMIIRMPGGREIVVDVKTPLDAYLSAVEASDDKSRDQHLHHHARKVRERIRELASKSYWSQFKNSPDFVVLFIPGDQFLSAALDKSPELLEYALQQKIILATPTSLVALLRAIAFGWNQEVVAESAEQIRQLGEDLYKRLNTFTNHLAKLGKTITSSVDNYNSAVGSFQRQLIPGARKFTEMGISASKEADDLDTIEKTIRPLSQTEKANN